MNFFLLCLLTLQLAFSTMISGDELTTNSSAKIERHPDFNITEIVLKNGMRFLLRPCKEEDDEVHVRFVAKGGYDSFPGANQMLAELTLVAGWESGIGSMSVDQQSIFLYENSIECEMKIEPNFRSVDASMPMEAVENYLKFALLYLSQPNFNLKEFERALYEKKYTLNNESKLKSFQLQDVLRGINLSGFENAKNMAEKEITQKDFELAQKIYQKSFSNPAEFSCVIVGDFSVDDVIKSITAIFGQVEKVKDSHEWTILSHIDFPNQVVHKVIHFHSRSDCMIKMAFPIEGSLSMETMPNFKLACKLIENRLNKSATSGVGELIAANVQDELPFFPSLDTAWITIQFRCDRKSSDNMIHKIVAEIKRLQEEGSSYYEIEELCKRRTENQNLWQNCNEYWLSILGNYLLWQAPLKWIKDENVDRDAIHMKINQFLKKSIKSDRLTTVSVIP